ncbi:MAG: HAD family hydrolase [Nitrospirota bacterium]|nr:HAD family hydrolase [Nitrospirota bacterium]
MQKCLFLDRDGVINYDHGDYTSTPEMFVLLPTVIDALQLATAKGYKLIVLTNQGGIAKKLYSEKTVRAIHDRFIRTCKESNVEITGIYFSPHHPDFGNSLTRKPESLLIERAIARHHIDPLSSVMIGDRDRDIECAAKAGVKGILIPTNADLMDYVKNLE